MLKKTEHLAWLILIGALLTCFFFTIGTPLGIRQYILHSTHPLDVKLQPRGEAVTLQKPGSSIKALVSGDTEVVERDRITLSSNASAFLLFYEDLHSTTVITPQPFITLQFYGYTDVSIESARTPRFAVSRLANLVILDFQRGTNTHITIEDSPRASRMRLQTPHGVIEAEKGTYTIVVGNNRTEFSVAVGNASIQDASGKTFALVSTQRVELTKAGAGEIQAGERNIMQNRNGDFEEPLEDYWEIKTSALPGESGGTVRQFPPNEQQIILFERQGENPAKTAIIQEINQDIRGAQSLRIRARIRVDMQTLAVCGSNATECPIMILVYITDSNINAPREWLQGFYTKPGTDEPFCAVCRDWNPKQIQVPQANIWYDYESEDLLPLLRERGFEPSAIRSVEINASGHTYNAAIDDIAILVGE